jgi:hypothetical protein
MTKTKIKKTKLELELEKFVETQDFCSGYLNRENTRRNAFEWYNKHKLSGVCAFTTFYNKALSYKPLSLRQSWVAYFAQIKARYGDYMVPWTDKHEYEFVMKTHKNCPEVKKWLKTRKAIPAKVVQVVVEDLGPQHTPGTAPSGTLSGKLQEICNELQTNLNSFTKKEVMELRSGMIELARLTSKFSEDWNNEDQGN